ncbi:zinc transport system substrate-binding protein [Geothermobacter ehrlichii]|uniref:Zinc transport system substrate-binding protein n=2 Tax=Geothermobacter ehrlichii TaxID=213224 RepID=A0A5D3WJN8_9BACT|nr:zinc transport system substrate-binding protein [Geothermobacter ehrlichii]
MIRMVVFFVCCLLTASPVFAAPKLVASLKPLADLAAGVVGDPSRVELLLPGGASPHSFTLRPSQMRALAAADLVVWVGPQLENFLVRHLASLPEERLLTFGSLSGVRLLPARRGGAWRHEAVEHDEDGDIDPHLWLDPDNARLLVLALAERLAGIDPENGTDYRRRAERLAGWIAALQQGLSDRLAAVRTKKYLVFHDAYQYFERAFGLEPLGALAIHPDRPPGARRLRELRDLLRRSGAVCVFSEPQFEPKLLRVLTEGLALRHGQLDPLGVDRPVSGASYLDLLAGLGDGLVSCLSN